MVTYTIVIYTMVKKYHMAPCWCMQRYEVAGVEDVKERIGFSELLLILVIAWLWLMCLSHFGQLYSSGKSVSL